MRALKIILTPSTHYENEMPIIVLKENGNSNDYYEKKITEKNYRSGIYLKHNSIAKDTLALLGHHTVSFSKARTKLHNDYQRRNWTKRPRKKSNQNVSAGARP